MMGKQRLVFLGFNSMLVHKRGVENVIHFQSQASPADLNYYIFWDAQTAVRRYENLICVGIKKNIFWFVALNVVLLKLKRKKCKIFIHSHNPLMSIMSFFQTDLFTVHDGLYYLTTATKHKLNVFFWLLEKLLYLRCSFVHFISEYAKKMSLHKSDKNYEIIANTSHFEVVNIDGFSDNNLRRFDIDVTKVFTVRSIEERALINLIIEVAGKLKNSKIEFFIAGKGPLLDFYRERIEKLELKNITLLGYVSDKDLLYYYNDCDIVLIPAAYGEGFGLPIIEGYFFDKPVIASNVCAIPEVIISEYFLFENTCDSVLSKLNFAKEMTHIKYRKHYDDFFSNKVVLSQMLALYKKLL